MEIVHRDDIVDRYRLVEPIGRGGSGVVWRARDLRLEREVALKEVSPPDTIDEVDRRRVQDSVLREARAAARLHHPGVVAVYDVVEQTDRQFIVMELVKAPDLAQVVAIDGPLDPARAAAIGLQLLEVLRVAHQAGIVHRDVKPSNVLVPSTGPCRLSDFGIASLMDDPSVTATGMIKGTPSYMSPEQAMAHPITPATDMWSLGATLYFAVEGQPPFDKGQVIATLTAIALEEPRHTLLAGALAPVLRAMLAKDPAQRPDERNARRSLQLVLADGPGGGRGLVVEAHAVVEAPAVVETLAESMVRPPSEAREPALDTASLPPNLGLAGRPADAEATARPPDRPPPLPPPPPAADGRPWDAMGGRAPEAGTPYAGRKKRHLPVTPVVGAVLVLLVAVALVASSGRGGSRRAASSPATTATTAAHGSAPAAPRPTAPAAPSATVPPGWTFYTDPDTGFKVAVPPAWAISRRGTLTDFRDPGSATYLRIDHQSPPAATADGPWYALEVGFAASNPGYRRLGITRVTFHGYDAAIWEYTYQSGATALHAIDIGMIVGDHGFGFNFQTTDSAWSQSQPLLTNLENGFRP